MPKECVQSISGITMDLNRIDDIAEKVLSQIMFELPEEAQTYDMALYILKRAKIKVKGMQVKL